MTAKHDSIGVVVLEPNTQFLDRLCGFSQAVWGRHEVLPRQTAKELHNAAVHLSIGVVIVRASYQQSNVLIRAVLLDLYARGTQIVVIQDTAAKLKEHTWVSLAGVHFLSDQAGDEQLNALLILTLAQHCLPSRNRFV